MPIYEYECRDCGHSFDLIHSYKDEEVKPCESCQSPDTYKVIHSPAVQFKGQGFYINDSRSDAKEAVKKKFEGNKYQTPEQRGDTSGKNMTTGIPPAKPKKKD
jgi:putative FmdB family regulatory protein